jgi:hypothetical protein
VWKRKVKLCGKLEQCLLRNNEKLERQKRGKEGAVYRNPVHGSEKERKVPRHWMVNQHYSPEDIEEKSQAVEVINLVVPLVGQFKKDK